MQMSQLVLIALGVKKVSILVVRWGGLLTLEL
jgi:hypothetical protein